MITVKWTVFLLFMLPGLPVLSLAPNQESYEILRDIQSSMRSMESRLGNLESKLLEVNLVEHAFRMNNIQSKVDETAGIIVEMSSKVGRIDSILNKLQLTDQEKKKWCNTDYGQNLLNLHKNEYDSLKRSMSGMLIEISELIRSGMGKVLIRMDSLLTDIKNQPTSSSQGSFKPSSITSSGSTMSRAGYELAGNGDGSTLLQLSNKMDTLMVSLRSCLSPNNSGGGNNNDNLIKTTLSQFRSLSQDTMNTMVKKIEATGNQLLTSVLSSLEVPQSVSQVKKELNDNLNKLRSQVDSLSSNAPILRILRHIKTQLPDVSRVTCMDEQTSELLEKASNQVNTMINDYATQIVSIDQSLNNVNSIVARLNSLFGDKYKSYVQNSSSDNMHTSITPSWQ